ncbi:RNA polymerase sigma-70 factor, ECF subfamily [Pedobacter sp. ok626]|uniref:RNA polymerase sigma factor n=1 Tax=Pedobacter sp. ok626 TaxID=1761882 RepID=UPI000886994B|nr:RNA polymerase sigma-70 factor [Pedobacter sp. ok626]SDJ27114.1 RNA polymerase sigma-70 factor, ECF subfamily [Pedobacter sp. ok626]
MSKIVSLYENDMLIRLKSGDEEAFDFFYKKHRGKIYGNILKLVKSTDIAADILQDVFIKVWNHAGGLDVEQSFEGYVVRIAQNSVYDFFRKASRQKKLEERLIASSSIEDHQDLDAGAELEESIKLLDQEINLLPPKCREVFQLCKIEGKSYDEVAALLNISTATVNNHIVRATRILKTRLSQVDVILILMLITIF